MDLLGTQGLLPTVSPFTTVGRDGGDVGGLDGGGDDKCENSKRYFLLLHTRDITNTENLKIQ